MINDNKRNNAKDAFIDDKNSLLEDTSLIKKTNIEKINLFSKNDMNFIGNIPVKISVELGKVKITIKEFLKLSKGSILSLDNDLNHPLNIFVNDLLIAQGEIVVVENKYGIRIINVMEKLK